MAQLTFWKLVLALTLSMGLSHVAVQVLTGDTRRLGRAWRRFAAWVNNERPARARGGGCNTLAEMQTGMRRGRVARLRRREAVADMQRTLRQSRMARHRRAAQLRARRRRNNRLDAYS